jgi:hypothetical protein
MINAGSLPDSGRFSALITGVPPRDHAPPVPPRVINAGSLPDSGGYLALITPAAAGLARRRGRPHRDGWEC